ncbi:hypothetical protein G7Y89_g9006 [Cudoniella acicularis]|uniref:C2H2-type domain-containing protein n=1 Tax=Cudoniella acicularis TaxID=354080 RepID=A0A8H4RFG6_9HELO|nr:hypothetical protein G7Y89_g9006 [Cudoniella acicularis]
MALFSHMGHIISSHFLSAIYIILRSEASVFVYFEYSFQNPLYVPPSTLTAPHPELMDSLYIDSNAEDSRQSRSRSNSYLSSTALQFQGLNIIESASSSSTPQVRPIDTHLSTSFLQQDSKSTPATHISCPSPQQLTPFPLLSESDLDIDWSYLEATGEQSGPTTPFLRVDPVQPYPGHRSSTGTQPNILRSNSFPANMSTLGIQQYDARFDGGIRQSYTWPHFEMNEQFMPQIPSPPLNPSMLTAYDDPKLMPIYARSLSSSPPRASLTPEQRELKRQRDHARRDSKTRARRERSVSNPYVVSQRNSPDLMPRTLPEYSNSLTPSPLLASGPLPGPQPSPALSSSSYLTPYSPQIGDSQTPEIYGPVFTMSPNDFTSSPTFTPMTYSNGGGDAGIQTFISRPHSLSSASDQPHMYQHHPSPKVGSSDSGDHVRVVHSRPKPQCWEHGCNGRQFSTFSNLLRHQREKSGAAAKSSCPNCGAEFTRTTARNGHMAHEKCKQRRNS